MPSLQGRSSAGKIDPQATRGEASQERAGVNHLLGHPCPSIPSLTLNQDACYSCGTRRCGVCLGPPNKGRMPRALPVLDIHAKREPRAFDRGTVSASSCDELTDNVRREKV